MRAQTHNTEGKTVMGAFEHEIVFLNTNREYYKHTDYTLSLQKIATKSHKNIKNKDKAMITEDSSLPLSFEGRIGLSKR